MCQTYTIPCINQYMTTHRKFKWSVFDLVTRHAACQPKTILDKYVMKKIICTRSEHVKILAPQSGRPGSAEDALSYANPTTSEN